MSGVSRGFVFLHEIEGGAEETLVPVVENAIQIHERERERDGDREIEILGLGSERAKKLKKGSGFLGGIARALHVVKHDETLG